MKKLTILLLLTATVSFANPFAHPSEAHGVLKLNQLHPSEEIFPVEIYAIDGKQINKRHGAVWLKPGNHSIKVTAQINTDQLNKSLTTQQKSFNRDNTQLNIFVEQGHMYYIGFDASDRNPNKWRPVVWKVETL